MFGVGMCRFERNGFGVSTSGVARGAVLVLFFGAWQGICECCNDDTRNFNDLVG